jgi:heat shock protein HslJ
MPLVTSLVTGCGGDGDASADASSLEGVPWVLASGVDVEGWEAVAPTVKLALLDADDVELLRYRAATPVGSWRATGFLQGGAFTTLLAGTEITASFDESGTLSGSAGCNAYGASYTTERGGIEIAKPAATRKACAEPDGIMEQEAAYLAALPTAVQYRVAGNLARAAER